MLLKEMLLKSNNAVEGNFLDLEKFAFNGVYIICNKDDEIVYIGSAYARDISIRLNQYLSKSDTGNTLGKTIATKLANQTKYNNEAKKRIGEAVDMIRQFKIYAIPHEDLEYQLIELANPKYNNKGKPES